MTYKPPLFRPPITRKNYTLGKRILVAPAVALAPLSRYIRTPLSNIVIGV